MIPCLHRHPRVSEVLWISFLLISNWGAASEWPDLPEQDGMVSIPAQEWPQRPGPRAIQVGIYYPDGTKGSVGPRTGLFLTLHNWGGLDVDGTAKPQSLAREFDVVAISVRYLQSGKKDSIEGPEPYDFGWLQGLDALRALWFVYDGLARSSIDFGRDRLFATGGSGGGNVALMANKLAPRTFTSVIDMCGMKKLSDALAYGLPSANGLNARWSRDPTSKNFLSSAQQEIRFVGHPQHLSEMKRLGNSAKVITIHGIEDKTCLEDGREMVTQMENAGIDVVPIWVTQDLVDGEVFTSTGHALGNRTRIPGYVAGKWLKPNGSESLSRTTPTDFERRENIRYSTSEGTFVISYEAGFPLGSFEPYPNAPSYSDHFDLLRVNDLSGTSQRVRTRDEWESRRRHILSALQQVMGPFPNPSKRVPLQVETMEEVQLDGGLRRRKVSFQSDATDRVAAYLFLPTLPREKRPAILCLQQTHSGGKLEPSGLDQKLQMPYALELARRGYVTLAPDYPGFGDSQYDFGLKHGYASGTMKAIWDNVRAIDFLETLPEVDPMRIGALGHSLGGHNAMFTAVFEPRIRAIVSSCGFTTFRKDDLPSWSGPRYMPRIASDLNHELEKMPFDFPEIVATFAPRPFLAIAAQQDSDFDVSGVHEVLDAARAVYRLHEAEANLQGRFPSVPHSFPPDVRNEAYDWFDRVLRDR